MKTIELTDDQLKNLMVFLNRVQLAGAEVPAYVELIRIINKVEDKPNPENNGQK
jgi:hypothetical protein